MHTHVVRQYMTASPETIAADLTLAQARDRMFQLQARHLPVVDNGELVGILSDRDLLLAEALEGDLHAVAAEMAEHRYGSAVVVDPEHPGHVLGLFTTTDALTALATIARA